VQELMGIGNDFLNKPQMAHQLREKIDKWEYMKLKSFCIIEEMVFKLKRLPIEWEKKIAKGLMTTVYRELKKLNSKKFNDTVKKWAKELNRAFSKEEIQIAKKHMQKYSISLTLKEMQIETTLRFHFTPDRMTTIKKTNNNKFWRGCGEKGTLIYC
jgi:hypothetical protein